MCQQKNDFVPGLFKWFLKVGAGEIIQKYTRIAVDCDYAKDIQNISHHVIKFWQKWSETVTINNKILHQWAIVYY